MLILRLSYANRAKTIALLFANIANIVDSCSITAPFCRHCLHRLHKPTDDANNNKQQARF